MQEINKTMQEMSSDADASDLAGALEELTKIKDQPNASEHQKEHVNKGENANQYDDTNQDGLDLITEQKRTLASLLGLQKTHKTHKAATVSVESGKVDASNSIIANLPANDKNINIQPMELLKLEFETLSGRTCNMACALDMLIDEYTTLYLKYMELLTNKGNSEEIISEFLKYSGFISKFKQQLDNCL